MTEKPKRSPAPPAALVHGELAPPIREEDIDSLLNPPAPDAVVMEGPFGKLKGQPHLWATVATHYRYVVIAITGLVLILAILFVVIFTSLSTEGDSLVAYLPGDQRIEAPNVLPSVTTPSGVADERWQRGTLTALAWDTWRYTPAEDGELTVFVRGMEAGMVPIVGLYSADGRLLATGAVRTGQEKQFSHAVSANTPYILLIGNIGGAAGSYEVRLSLT